MLVLLIKKRVEKKNNGVTLKVILENRNLPSFFALEVQLKIISMFTFCLITLEEILKEMCNLDTSKSSQDKDILRKVIKGSSDIFASFICKSFNDLIYYYYFQQC